jgi:hypothetical protein
MCLCQKIRISFAFIAAKCCFIFYVRPISDSLKPMSVWEQEHQYYTCGISTLMYVFCVKLRENLLQDFGINLYKTYHWWKFLWPSMQAGINWKDKFVEDGSFSIPSAIMQQFIFRFIICTKIMKTQVVLLVC